MKLFRTAAVMVCVALAAAFAAPGTPKAQSLDSGFDLLDVSGRWNGVYYDCAACGGPVAFSFNAWMPAFGAKILAESAEPNTFGDRDAPELFANWEIEMRGGRLHMRKIYDGSGGQSHAVLYVGDFVSRDRIEGRWSIGAVGGRFVLERRAGSTS